MGMGTIMITTTHMSTIIPMSMSMNTLMVQWSRPSGRY